MTQPAVAKSSAPPARSSVPASPVASTAPDPVTHAGTHPSGFGRWLLVLAAGLVVVCVLGYRVLSRNKAELVDTAVTTTQPEPGAAVTPTAVAESAPVASAAEPAPAATAVETAPVLSAAEPAPLAPAAESASAAAPPPAPAADIRRVTVKSKPPKVRFFHFGKQVGVTPFVLEFKPGERHAYEAGLPGYGTRKVVIDGSKPEVVIGLRRDQP
jgi:hypothetical protein